MAPIVGPRVSQGHANQQNKLQTCQGTVRHFYSAHPRMSSEIQERGIDLLTPIWHVFDLTPQGRGDWYTKLEYPKRSQA
ncbi:MAG TPA: DUF899 family protein [Terriglobales bacterium]|nr:DUF899 family protein [Terriglobales bacterium]